MFLNLVWTLSMVQSNHLGTASNYFEIVSKISTKSVLDFSVQCFFKVTNCLCHKNRHELDSHCGAFDLLIVGVIKTENIVFKD